MLRRISIKNFLGYKIPGDFYLIGNIVANSFLQHLALEQFIVPTSVTLEFHDKNDRLERVRRGDRSIVMVEKYFDFDSFWLKSDKERLKILVVELKDELIKLNKELNWGVDKLFFEDAYENTLRSDFNWSASLTNYITYKSVGAKLFYQREGELLVVYAILYKEDKEMNRVKVLNSWAIPGNPEEAVVKVKWLNEQDLVITPKDVKRFKIIVRINGDVVLEGDLGKTDIYSPANDPKYPPVHPELLKLRQTNT